MLSRRAFIQATAAGAIVPAFGSIARAGAPVGAPATRTSKTVSDAKLTLSAPLTHSDWMLKPGIAWGPAGVHHMLDACKACGWSRIYWRVLDGGRADYPSRIVRPFHHWDADSFWSPQSAADRALLKRFDPNMTDAHRAALLAKFDRMDYAQFDSLAEAIRYGHQIGVQIHAWVSINEDDHGWGLISDFSRDHPQFRWVKRDGRVYRSHLSFAFPQVRAYKLAILDELLKNYAIDGLFLDWIRTGDVRDNPQTDARGIADSGYESPLVEAFKSKYGVDPHDMPNDDDRWVRMRAQPQTLFMREAHKLSSKANKPLAVLVGHPWHFRGFNDPIDGNLRGLLLDVKTWAKEGLIEAAVPAGYYRAGGNAQLAYQALRAETGGNIDIWTYAWVPTSVADFDHDFAIAQSVDANQILFWEADYIDDRPDAAKLKAQMSARARG